VADTGYNNQGTGRPTSIPINNVSVSLIVPIRNAEGHVESLIEAISGLICGDLEVIVVDNNSQDATWERLRAMRRGLGREFLLLREDGSTNSYAARNCGIRAARGDILVFTDADCRPKADWLVQMAGEFRVPRVGLVAGAIQSAGGSSWIERYSSRHGMLSQSYTLRHPYLGYGQTASLAIRRSVLQDIGMFRPNMVSGGDADLCWRAIRGGWQLAYAPESIVFHHHRSSLRELWEQWYRYGRGHKHLCRLHGQSVLPSSWHSVLSERITPYIPTALNNMANAIRRGDVSVVADLPLALVCWRAFAVGTQQTDLDLDVGDPPRLQAQMAVASERGSTPMS